MTFNAATPSALGRVLRDQRIIWWTLLVSLVLAWLGSLPARAAFSEVLDHSLASQRLVHGFDLGTFAELMSSPEIPQGALVAASTAQFGVFFIFLLFTVGGINAAYASEARLTTGEFFHACGGYFWRMVRLTLTSLIPFAIVGGGMALISHWSTGLEESPNERLSDYAQWGGILALGLVMLFIRAWFDLAQARTVAWGERGMFKTALRTIRLVTFRLYLCYAGLCALRLALVALCLWTWMRIAPESTTKSFLLMEAIVLVHIVTRLWQRAASVRAMEAVPRP